MSENVPADDQQKPQPTPVTFSPEQQAKIDEIVKLSMGRAASQTRVELAQEKQRATQLETQLRETQSKADLTAAERDELKRKHADAEQRISTLRKKAFITEACIDHGFIDALTVNSLVEQQLDWSEDKQDFVVIGSDVSTNEFFSDFAKTKPYLVRSTIHTGSGASASSRTGLPTGQERYKPEDIFGRGSNSRLANDLARTNPAEYQRLKKEARNKRLV